MEKTRKLAAANLQIIYGYFDLLEKRINELNIQNRPECIWNVDETNLYSYRCTKRKSNLLISCYLSNIF